MPLPQRKTIRLSEYSYDNGGSYFLTICTKDRTRLLSRIELCDEGEYPYDGDGRYLRVLLTEYGKIAEKHLQKARTARDVRVERYVIMPDHIHMIVSVAEESWQTKERGSTEKIPCFVSMFKRLCHREIGNAIFQRAYYDHVIRNVADREAIEAYVSRNPARWYFREIYGREE